MGTSPKGWMIDVLVLTCLFLFRNERRSMGVLVPDEIDMLEGSHTHGSAWEVTEMHL